MILHNWRITFVVLLSVFSGCVAGVTFEGSFIPAWLEGSQLGTQLESAITDAKEALTATDEALKHLGQFPDYLLDIYSSPKLSKNAFPGIWAQISISEFTHAWRTIVAVTATPIDPECEPQLSLWLKRPLWLVPSYDEVVAIRDCLETAVYMLDKSSVNATTGLTIAGAVVELIPPFFSFHTERTLRQSLTAVDNLPQWQSGMTAFGLFRPTLESHPKIHQRLVNAPLVAAAVFTNPTDEYYYTNYGQTVYLRQHLVDFVEHQWSRAALSHTGGHMLPLWQTLVVAGNDMGEAHFDVGKLPLFQNPAVFFRNAATHNDVLMGASISSWLKTVGGFILRAAAVSSEGVKACLPTGEAANADLYTDEFDVSTIESVRQLYYFITGHVETITPMYRCLIDGVESGSIQILQDENEAESVAVLMHMIRLSTSAAAYIVSVTP